jgi:hypothetical protein
VGESGDEAERLEKSSSPFYQHPQPNNVSVREEYPDNFYRHAHDK